MQDAKDAISRIVWFLMVDDGGELMPFHRKIRSSAQQAGRNGNGLRLVAPSSSGNYDVSMEAASPRL